MEAAAARIIGGAAVEERVENAEEAANRVEAAAAAVRRRMRTSSSTRMISIAMRRMRREEPGAAGDGGGGDDDACIDAMASFVSESREWALAVQGFLIQHCRSFEAIDENRLEWTELHLELQSLMEGLLEAELAKLGVSVDDFVTRLRAHQGTSKAAEELIETVIAMDDFHSFKQMMLRLKADLEGSSLPQDTLDQFCSRQ